MSKRAVNVVRPLTQATTNRKYPRGRRKENYELNLSLFSKVPSLTTELILCDISNLLASLVM